MSTGWNKFGINIKDPLIINLLGNEYWLELCCAGYVRRTYYKPTGK